MVESTAFAQHILDNYERLRRLEADMQAKKLKPLQQLKPKYVLFDFEHPYYDIAKDAKLAVKGYEKMVKEMKDVQIADSTLESEFDKLRMINALKGTKNPYLDRLAKLCKPKIKPTPPPNTA